MLYAHRSTRAESMIETILAITVIIIGTAAALSTLRHSLSGNELVGEKEVAINLGLEALDALKNVRDTNYLLFSADADDCWNKLNASIVSDCTDGTALRLRASTPYYFSRSIDVNDDFLEWQILTIGSSSTKGYLTLYDVDLGDGRTIPLYAQAGITDSRFTTVQTRAFYRTMSLVYNTAGDAYDATVNVSWTENNVTHSISLTRTIANVY